MSDQKLTELETSPLDDQKNPLRSGPRIKKKLRGEDPHRSDKLFADKLLAPLSENTSGQESP
jgi:hypothetical protein